MACEKTPILRQVTGSYVWVKGTQVITYKVLVAFKSNFSIDKGPHHEIPVLRMVLAA